jgi:uncharacterized protein (TIGR03437 family)
VPIVCSSNGGPIAFAVAVGGQMGTNMIPSLTSGIAYSWGTTVNVTVPLSYLLPIAIGTPLTGTVTITPTNGAPAVVITLNVNINLPTPTITSYSVSELPVDLALDHTVVVTGTGFQQGTTLVEVKYNTGTYATLDINHVTISSPTSMVVTLDHGTYLAAPHTLISMQASNATPAVWAGSLPALAVVTTPIIYAVTNAASFTETPGVNTVVSPYEIISIFGANFDPANGLVNNTSYTAAPGVFGTSVLNSQGSPVVVSFCVGNTAITPAVVSPAAAAVCATPLAKAPIIFVSNNQINAIVPSAIVAGANDGTHGANILVTVGNIGNDATNNIVLLDGAASTPAIFTPGGSGRGAGAVLNQDYTLNTATNPVVKATAGNALMIYATGLGITTSTGVDTAAITTAFVPASSCISETNYLALLSGADVAAIPTTAAGGGGTTPITGSAGSFTALDGALINPANLWSGVFPPCFTPSGTGYQIQLGTGVVLTPSYVGMVTGSVAGLYQINVNIPSSYTYAPAVLAAGGPIALTVLFNNLPVSQPGVIVYVK